LSAFLPPRVLPFSNFSEVWGAHRLPVLSRALFRKSHSINCFRLLLTEYKNILDDLHPFFTCKYMMLVPFGNYLNALRTLSGFFPTTTICAYNKRPDPPCFYFFQRHSHVPGIRSPNPFFQIDQTGNGSEHSSTSFFSAIFAHPPPPPPNTKACSPSAT